MMGIKQKDENSAGGLHNTLATGTTVKGNIITETDFRLDGQVEGDISCNARKPYADTRPEAGAENSEGFLLVRLPASEKQRRYLSCDTEESRRRTGSK